MSGHNVTRRVSWRGGLIGLFSGESQGKALERELMHLNADGYRLVFIISDRWNFFARLWWWFVFVLTLFLYSRQQNILVIGERMVGLPPANAAAPEYALAR